MAKVLVNYTGVVSGSGNIYVYKQPDNASGTNGFYVSGNQVMIYAKDGGPDISNGFYHIGSSPGGWMYTYRISSITANYQTVRDICTPPTAVTLNTTTKVLTITGGAGGDLNALEGFGVSWRDRNVGTSTWGDWSEDTLIEDRTVSVTVPAGSERQFRVRTCGAAGEDYYSDYVECPTLLVGNTAPSSPTITRPSSGAVTNSTTPVVILTCPADPEGDAMTLKRKVDGGSWQNAANVPGTGGTVKDKLPTLGAGAHTIQYTLTDSHGLVSGTATVSLTVTLVSWGRTIAAGSVIANQEISHRADITELRTAVNAQRAFYGLSAMTLPGVLGNFSSWKAQMESLQTAIGQSLAVAGVSAPTWLAVLGWPSAAVINQIRAAVILA